VSNDVLLIQADGGRDVLLGANTRDPRSPTMTGKVSFSGKPIVAVWPRRCSLKGRQARRQVEAEATSTNEISREPARRLLRRRERPRRYTVAIDETAVGRQHEKEGVCVQKTGADSGRPHTE
jgi:hypothetical protein